MKEYDFLIVGAGLFGSVFAHEANRRGYNVLVIDRRNHIGGNAYTYKLCGTTVHKYGAHIFHTDDDEVWNYVTQFGEFNSFINMPIAKHGNKTYNLPFNMNTFHQLWGVNTPDEAKAIIDKQRCEIKGKPENLEQRAISLVGRDIYETFIKYYSEKQWGRKCSELPPFLIDRIPIRFTYDNNYFNDKYQGIPQDGYTKLIERMLEGTSVRLGTSFNKERDMSIASKIVYTGAIDEFFDFCYGRLEYRSLRFETRRLNMPDFQSNAIINYTGAECDYTRIIEHKHFDADRTNIMALNQTVVTYEYPIAAGQTNEPYYPINDDKNNKLFAKYNELADGTDVIFGGRLAQYAYLDMDDTVRAALDYVKKWL